MSGTLVNDLSIFCCSQQQSNQIEHGNTDTSLLCGFLDAPMGTQSLCYRFQPSKRKEIHCTQSIYEAMGTNG